MIRIGALILFFMLTAMAVPCLAVDNQRAALPMKHFRALPVLHEGRLKPLARFAAVELGKLSADSSPLKPARWLAETLFNPQMAVKQPLFKITNPALQVRFNLPTRKSKLYSLEEIGGKLEQTQTQALRLITQDQDQLTTDQRALVKLHENALAYGQLLQALSVLLPLDLDLPQAFALPEGTLPSYSDIRKQEPALMAKLRALIAAKGEDPALYNEEEKKLARLAFEYQQLRQAAGRNHLLRIIPPQWQNSDEWLAPWALLHTGHGSPESAKLLELWQEMALAYHDGDRQRWLSASESAYDMAIAQSGDQGLSQRLKIERLYNKLSPFKLAFALYGFALLLAAIYFYRHRPVFYAVSALALLSAITAHLAGIIMRVIILVRPPVGSLYESLLFVSLIIAATGLLLEYRRRDGFALTGAAAASLLILFIAPVVAPAGDDLEMLVAVLNTNFWLAVHVICITAGYGICILTAVLAHIWLLRAGLGKRRQNGLSRNIYILSLVALLLTAVGTVLGGIWADQSWGRFWGWDPKENGALLIVLWLVWLHHGKLGGQMNIHAFHAGLAALNIIVALAWFGVNLLSVGLHSYGFTSGIAAGLAGFCMMEIILIGMLYSRIRFKKTIKHET